MSREVAFRREMVVGRCTVRTDGDVSPIIVTTDEGYWSHLGSAVKVMLDIVDALEGIGGPVNRKLWRTVEEVDADGRVAVLGVGSPLWGPFIHGLQQRIVALEVAEEMAAGRAETEDGFRLLAERVGDLEKRKAEMLAHWDRMEGYNNKLGSRLDFLSKAVERLATRCDGLEGDVVVVEAFDQKLTELAREWVEEEKRITFCQQAIELWQGKVEQQERDLCSLGDNVHGQLEKLWKEATRLKVDTDQGLKELVMRQRLVEQTLDKITSGRCPQCGQTEAAHQLTGEHPCPTCGAPRVHDEGQGSVGAPDARDADTAETAAWALRRAVDWLGSVANGPIGTATARAREGAAEVTRILADNGLAYDTDGHLVRLDQEGSELRKGLMRHFQQHQHYHQHYPGEGGLPPFHDTGATEPGLLEAMRLPPDVLDIVFDGPPGPDGGRFVEVEDDTGKSIRLGVWVLRPDGLWALRIPDPRRDKR